MPIDLTATSQESIPSNPSRYLTGVVFPLVLGTAIYCLFRDREIFLFELLRQLGLNDFPSIEIPRNCEFLATSLPDGLWVYSFTRWLSIIWGRVTTWHFVPPLLAIGSEIGQVTGLVPGTFDSCDLFAYLLAFSLALKVKT